MKLAYFLDYKVEKNICLQSCPLLQIHFMTLPLPLRSIKFFHKAELQ